MNNSEKHESIAKDKNLFEIIKSKIILKAIFNNIEYNIQLFIIRYNKSLQNKFGLLLSDYKEYSEKKDKIIIEIIQPGADDSNCINHDTIENFDEDDYEISTYYKNGIKTIELVIGDEIKTFEGLFKFCKYIEKVTFVQFYRDDITDMNYMFYGCSSLEEVCFKNKKSNFKTNNVTNMTHMFYGCSSLKKVDLSNIDTSSVIDMSSMFFDCSSLKEVNLSNLNNKNVINMNYMFHGCISLEKINLTNFKTENVVQMKKMFNLCTSLEEIDLSSFDTSNVENMNTMFGECEKLKYLDISNFVTKKLKNMYYMFYYCSSLEELKFNIVDVDKSYRCRAFKGCKDSLKNKFETYNNE